MKNILKKAVELIKKAAAKISVLVKNNKRTVLFGAVAFAVVIAVLVVSLIIKNDKIGGALNQKNFEKVSVTYSMALIDRSPVSEDSSVQYTTSGTDELTSVLGDGTESTDDTETDEDTSDDIDDSLTEMCVMDKYGDIIHETGLTGERYYYTRDGEDMVLYYDDYYGLKEDDGTWTEIYSENTYATPAFDVTKLKSYKKSDFERTSDGYYTIKDYTDKYFYKLIGINDESKYKYTELKFWFESKKLSKIEATYIYDGSYEGKIVYEFDYSGVKKITVPKADVKAEKNED